MTQKAVGHAVMFVFKILAGLFAAIPADSTV